jgi:hypothetical protein
MLGSVVLPQHLVTAESGPRPAPSSPMRREHCVKKGIAFPPQACPGHGQKALGRKDAAKKILTMRRPGYIHILVKVVVLRCVIVICVSTVYLPGIYLPRTKVTPLSQCILPSTSLSSCFLIKGGKEWPERRLLLKKEGFSYVERR